MLPDAACTSDGVFVSAITIWKELANRLETTTADRMSVHVSARFLSSSKLFDRSGHIAGRSGRRKYTRTSNHITAMRLSLRLAEKADRAILDFGVFTGMIF